MARAYLPQLSPQRLWQRLGCWQLFAARDRGATSSVAPEAILNHYHQL